MPLITDTTAITVATGNTAMKINNLVDLHCHILPAIDYGSPSLEASLELARQAVADEIRYILATPHTSYGSALPQSCR